MTILKGDQGTDINEINLPEIRQCECGDVLLGGFTRVSEYHQGCADGCIHAAVGLWLSSCAYEEWVGVCHKHREHKYWLCATCANGAKGGQRIV